MTAPYSLLSNSCCNGCLTYCIVVLFWRVENALDRAILISPLLLDKIESQHAPCAEGGVVEGATLLQYRYSSLQERCHSSFTPPWVPCFTLHAHQLARIMLYCSFNTPWEPKYQVCVLKSDKLLAILLWCRVHTPEK